MQSNKNEVILEEQKAAEGGALTKNAPHVTIEPTKADVSGKRVMI